MSLIFYLAKIIFLTIFEVPQQRVGNHLVLPVFGAPLEELHENIELAPNSSFFSLKFLHLKLLELEVVGARCVCQGVHKAELEKLERSSTKDLLILLATG